MQNGQQAAGTAGTSAPRVRDPVTGGRVTLKDATENPEEVPPGQNVLRLAFPPPELEAQRKYLFNLFSTTVNRMTLAFMIVPIAAFALAPRVLSSRPLLLLLPTLSIPAAFTFLWKYRMQSKSQDDADRRVWDVERRRGFMAGYDIDGDGLIESEERMKESAEWFNSLFRGLWPIINPDMFSSTVDMLEDIMQASVPSYIHSVRIPDLGLGTNPIRITSIRALPDSEMEPVVNSLQEEEREYIQGEHVNWELSFAYRAAPNKTKWSEKAENFHLLIEFYLGIKGIAALPIPVWAEITGIVGTARMRLELIPDPPFIKHTLITLVGLPKVSISITPIHKKLLPNMMDIPFLSRFITQSIDLAAKQYMAPKSLMLDLQQMLSGDGIKRDTDHIGVVVVHIHQIKISKAARIKVGDVDAYINVCLSPMNKTQYTTRTISKTLEPVFEETAVLLVDVNAAKIGEKVTLEVWDSDRFTDDDLVGRVEVDVAELISNHNTTFRRAAAMKNSITEAETGIVEYTMGYYSKVTPGCRDASPDIPQEILDRQDFKKARKSTLTDLLAAVAVTPPHEDFLSGILGIQLHEIRELGLKASNAALKNEGKGSSEKPEGEEELESDKALPSSYCTVLLNDEPIYRSRTKTMTATPFFNTSTERFVKDWKAAHVCVVVRDSRMRETDPIIGMVFFKLSDLFRNGSMATGSWSLQYGTGFGRIHLSFVFRPVQLTMSPSLIGFDTGTIEIDGVTITLRDASILNDIELRLATSGGFTNIKKKRGLKPKDDDSDEDTRTFDHTLITLPILTRYHSALVLKLCKKGFLHRTTLAIGTVWLRDLVDNHTGGVVKATLWAGGDQREIKENYSKPDENVPGSQGEALGEVELKVVFKPGVADVHEKGMQEDPDARKVWEEYVIMKREGLRKNIGRQDVVVQVTEAHASVNTNTVSVMTAATV